MKFLLELLRKVLVQLGVKFVVKYSVRFLVELINDGFPNEILAEFVNPG